MTKKKPPDRFPGLERKDFVTTTGYTVAPFVPSGSEIPTAIGLGLPPVPKKYAGDPIVLLLESPNAIDVLIRQLRAGRRILIRSSS